MKSKQMARQMVDRPKANRRMIMSLSTENA